MPIDATTLTDAGVVPCHDAGDCNASDSYCRIVTEAGTTSFTCTSLAADCHSCDCAAPPTPGYVCVCTSSGAQIIVSCNEF